MKEKGKQPTHRSSDKEEEEVNVPTYMTKDKIHPIAKGPKLKEAPKTLKEKWTHQPADWKPLADWSTKMHAVVEDAR